MTVKSKKRRLKRAHAHQAHCKGRDQFFNALEVVGGKPLVPWQKDIVLNSLGPVTDSLKDFTPTHAGTEFGTIELKPPSRAKCPSCGFSQKVRKNGTMSRHDVFMGSDPRECEGSGEPWNA